MNRKEKQLIKELNLAVASITKKRKYVRGITWALWSATFIAWIIFFAIILN